MAGYGGYGGKGNNRAPHRDTQFDTMNLEAPVRVHEKPRPAVGGEALSAGYEPPGITNHVSAAAGAPPARVGQRIPRGLLITSLILRLGALMALVVALAVLASDSHHFSTYVGDDYVTVTFSFSTLSSTKYALAVAIVGAIYSIYEIISTSVRLGKGHLLLPGKISLFISYIGDQIVIVLLLTGGSAVAGIFVDLMGGSSCGIFCNQGAGVVAMIFLGFCFLAASLVISSFCLYKNRT